MTDEKEILKTTWQTSAKDWFVGLPSEFEVGVNATSKGPLLKHKPCGQIQLVVIENDWTRERDIVNAAKSHICSPADPTS